MKEIVSLLPVLLAAMLMNIMAGTYFNIGKQNIVFDWKKLASGIMKAGIVCHRRNPCLCYAVSYFTIYRKSPYHIGQDFRN